MHRLSAIFLLVLTLSTARAQQPQELSFASPFDFPLYLSANFGELRSGHFHGGLDIKTQGVVGHPIHAIADGHISRVTISSGGYGQAMYIEHPNGYTSVYGHLDHFLPAMEQRIRQQQYAQENFITTLDFGPDEYPVKQGDIIAFAGNTGYSFGPHLHMEIRITDSNEPIDPLPYYRHLIADNIAPRASHIMLYPKEGSGCVNGSDQKFTFTPSAAGNQPVAEAWGTIGTAIEAKDYMNDTHNNYGVRHVRLFVDDQLVSESVVDRFSFDENRTIDNWTDIAERRRSGRWFMRSTIDEGNDLRMLHAHQHHGWINIREERPYHLRYELTDLYGNHSTYRFIIQGKRSTITPCLPNYLYYLSAQQPHSLQWDGLSLWLPQGSLYHAQELHVQQTTSTRDQADIVQLTTERIPLRHDAELRLRTYQPLAVPKEHYYIARVEGNRRYYVGGEYAYGWMKASIRELGTYTISIDTIAPRLTPVSAADWGRRGRIIYRMSDGETGIHSFRGTIDGQWVLFTYSAKNSLLQCDLQKEGITRGRHRLQLVITDYCGNKRISTTDFIY